LLLYAHQDLASLIHDWTAVMGRYLIRHVQGRNQPLCSADTSFILGNHRFRHSSMAAKSRIKARESERKASRTNAATQEADEPF
jgi:hypothetical protein